jgi:5'-nucleotidase/UDP-sugar diphosphatase
MKMNWMTPALAGLLMIAAAGCSTTTRGPSDPAPEPPPPAAPVMTVDPWAKSASPAPASEPPAPVPAVVEPPARPAPEEPAAAAPATNGSRTHTVVKGDTLYQISVKYYGTGSKWPRIVEANPGLKPERMPVGKTIVIP